MRARRSARRAALLPSGPAPSGTARRDSPFRVGQEDQSPTPLVRTLEQGSGCEIRCRRTDDGMGDESAWSTGNALATLGRQRLGGAPRSLFVLECFGAQVKIKNGTLCDQTFQTNNQAASPEAPQGAPRCHLCITRATRAPARQSAYPQRRSQGAQKFRKRYREIRSCIRCVPPALPRTNGTVIYEPFTLMLQLRP